MSIESSTAAGLPVVNQALEPASVRHGSAATKKAYQSALAFEEVLVEQLSKSLTATLGGGESSGEGGSEEGGSSGFGSGSSELSAMLPQALSAGVMNAGGLGLAAQMTKSLESVEAKPAGGSGLNPSGSGAAPAATPVDTTTGPGGGVVAATTGGSAA